MSTITREFTKEQLIEQAKKNIEVLRGAVEKIPGSSDAAVIHLKLAEITLASLEAEPVAFRSKLKPPYAGSERWDYTDHRQPDAFELENCFIERLYSAPPAPVSVPDEMTMADAIMEIDAKYADMWTGRIGFQKGWNACRAAMLHGAAGNSPVIPDWQAKAEKMAELHGTSFVVFRNGESPQCADPSKVIISFTDEGLGHSEKGHFREISNSSTNNFRENAETSTKCWCHTCRPVTISDMRFVVCPDCGNKRCPHANDHRHACTGSNEPGQEGSAYPAAPQQDVKP
ncbi:hypothetical protein SFF81_000817 [Salmonella enterica]|nr:hypothetical protein [Salmonella enterica]EJO6102156.1 hypothetical protein [Salmonella enterica]EJP2313912.1 hypothetical protein [Salmonella enterica]EKN6669093.1 hypothetical protein [Salmonella enterica]ELV0820656.1 hypothetical protein [Salmonella enterica]